MQKFKKNQKMGTNPDFFYRLKTNAGYYTTIRIVVDIIQNQGSLGVSVMCLSVLVES